MVVCIFDNIGGNVVGQALVAATNTVSTEFSVHVSTQNPYPRTPEYFFFLFIHISRVCVCEVWSSCFAARILWGVLGLACDLNLWDRRTESVVTGGLIIDPQVQITEKPERPHGRLESTVE